MNQEQKKEAKKLPGFYIALCCCVLAIGVAGFFTERYNAKHSESVISEKIKEAETTDAPVFSSQSDTYIPPAATAAPAIDVSESNEAEMPVVSEPQPVEDYAVDNPDTSDDAIMVSSEQPAFIMPVMGNILEEYSDKLKYNSALSDWRTHNGIDIAAEKGCSVQSVADGVIDSVYEDATGGCVVISHAAGFITKYMGLDSVENLTEGKEIKSGEVVGMIGDSKGENVTDTHLHFEMSKDGVNVNPCDYLPKE